MLDRHRGLEPRKMGFADPRLVPLQLMAVKILEGTITETAQGESPR